MIQNEQNRLDPNLFQASIQGPLNFTHHLLWSFMLLSASQSQKPVSCVLGFCYCSALFLVPQSAPAAFCYATSHYNTSRLTTATWAVLGVWLVSLPCSVSCGGLSQDLRDHCYHRAGNSSLAVGFSPHEPTTGFACSAGWLGSRGNVPRRKWKRSKIYIQWNVHIFIYNLGFN